MVRLVSTVTRSVLPHCKRFGAKALLLAIAFLFGNFAHAQGITGSISGTVTDGTGAVVPGATVTVAQTQTNVTRTVNSSSSGRYVLPQLAPGTYKVHVSKQASASIGLVIDGAMTQNTPLKAGTAAGLLLIFFNVLRVRSQAVKGSDCSVWAAWRAAAA